MLPNNTGPTQLAAEVLGNISAVFAAPIVWDSKNEEDIWRDRRCHHSVADGFGLCKRGHSAFQQGGGAVAPASPSQGVDSATASNHNYAWDHRSSAVNRARSSREAARLSSQMGACRSAERLGGGSHG